MRARISTSIARVLFVAMLAAVPSGASAELPPGEASAIAEEAFVYAYPMVMAYATLYEYAIDEGGPQYRAPFNQLFNEHRVFTPKDTAVVTPNSDTPYSFVWMDLRAEPQVLCVPEVEKRRYYSVQLTSLYTFNFAYIGSRATGNGRGCYAVAGPGWKGDKPEGVVRVFRSETQFALAIYRTQLLGPDDMPNVERVQDGYTVGPLSAFLDQPAPPPAPAITWPKIDKKLAASDPFAYLSFLLQFAPPIGPAAVEKPMRARFAEIGIEAGKSFSADALGETGKAEIEVGVKNALEKIEKRADALGTDENGWRIMKSGFGNRAALDGDFTLRAAVAMAGIFGNDAAEALYPLTRSDGEGRPLDGSAHAYTLTFPAGQLPPVNAFWSVTMYDGKTQLLIENPIHRYLINSPMLPGLEKNEDGSLTLFLQKDSPGKEKEANWLPAPDGPIYLVMRLYWPKRAAIDGAWKPPAVQQAR